MKTSKDSLTHYQLGKSGRTQRGSKLNKIVGKTTIAEHNQTCETPAKQMAHLELKQKIKSPKLLSSKSLSNLIPRKLFFKKTISAGSQFESCSQNGQMEPDSRLTQANSPPTSFIHDLSAERPMEIVNRVNSVSLIGLGRQSSSCSFSNNGSEYTLDEPSLSPIATVDGAAGPPLPARGEEADCKMQNERDSKTEEEERKQRASSKCRPFKSTKLVLRDVKNSIGLVSPLAISTFN